jgi:alkylation response protein AidB-like acyl-CoA dehydrogenase
VQFELQPLTEAGRQYVALAESHIAELAAGADLHDRAGSFPAEHVASIQNSGFMAACAPRELGGLGVATVHDFMVAINRLGRGDGSTAIAVSMHCYAVFMTARSWRAATAAGETAKADALARLLESVVRKETVICALGTEPGTDLLHPRVTATRIEGGWLVNGRKSFATMSEAATLASTTVRLIDDQGMEHIAEADLPLGRTGIAVQHTWDALGMRGSGSHDVVFTDCFAADADVAPTGPYGEYAEWFLLSVTVANVGLMGAFLGIAEAARDCALGLVTSRRRPSGRVLAESYAIQQTVAEIEIDLAACRAMSERSAQTVDAVLAAHPPGDAPIGELHDLNKDFQCTKWFVQRKAIEIVDRALQLSGGSGYLSRSPLSRLYRDVRAGPFMQPFSPNEAFQYIGKVTLGLDPHIE